MSCPIPSRASSACHLSTMSSHRAWTSPFSRLARRHSWVAAGGSPGPVLSHGRRIRSHSPSRNPTRTRKHTRAPSPGHRHRRPRDAARPCVCLCNCRHHRRARPVDGRRLAVGTCSRQHCRPHANSTLFALRLEVLWTPLVMVTLMINDLDRQTNDPRRRMIERSLTHEIPTKFPASQLRSRHRQLGCIFPSASYCLTKRL